MKLTKYLFLSIILMISFLTYALASTNPNVAFLVREPNHLKAALLTLEQMHSGKLIIQYTKASIVVCGPKGIEAIKKGSPFEDKLKAASTKNVEIKACGLTLKELNITVESLSKNVTVVENGLFEMIRLKHQGYLSVDL